MYVRQALIEWSRQLNSWKKTSKYKNKKPLSGDNLSTQESGKESRHAL